MNDIGCVCVVVFVCAWKCVCERECARQLVRCYCVCCVCTRVLCGVQSTLVVRLVCVSFVNMYGLALQLCVCDDLCVCVCACV